MVRECVFGPDGDPGTVGIARPALRIQLAGKGLLSPWTATSSAVMC
jgi:hypothetical protein